MGEDVGVEGKCRRLAATTLVVVVLGACTSRGVTDQGGTNGDVAPVATAATTTSLAPGEIAPGLRLVPGDDGTVPVKARWVKAVDTPEAMAVHDGTVLVAGAVVSAFDLRDGSEQWEADDHGAAFDSDGGVRIGMDGPDVVRVFAPWNYDLRLDRGTGRQQSIDRSVLGSPDPPLSELTNSAPASVRVVPDLKEIVVYHGDGSTAWKLLSSSAFVEPLPAVSVGESLILATSDQYVVVLDPVR